MEKFILIGIVLTVVYFAGVFTDKSIFTDAIDDVLYWVNERYEAFKKMLQNLKDRLK